MQKLKLFYFILVFITMLIGLLSRRFSIIPLWIGDVLWAAMVYSIVRVLFTRHTMKWAATVSLLFSFSIEISQLYQQPWINKIRATTLGHLVLGQTFSWGDMLSYTLGVSMVFILDNLIISKLGPKPGSLFF